jgi:hypothetical protein
MTEVMRRGTNGKVYTIRCTASVGHLEGDEANVAVTLWTTSRTYCTGGMPRIAYMAMCRCCFLQYSVFLLARPSYRRAADAYPSIGLQPWMSLPSGKRHRK